MAGILLLIFKDLNKVTLQSPTGKSLTSAFLEIAAAAADIGSGTFILDGELAIPTQNGFSFDLLLSVWGGIDTRLVQQIEASPEIYTAFDLLSAKSGSSHETEILER